MSKDDLSQDEIYFDRETSYVKHQILREYLEQFAHIIGFNWNVINYVDCFSGPWGVKSDDYRDSSFAIALSELRLARQTHLKLKPGNALTLRCFFLEKNPSAYSKLKEFADKENGIAGARISTKNAALEDSISDILKFVAEGGKSFSFVFIDPTGWTGFSMEKITLLLKLKNSEVLINLMTGDIRRFVESPDDATQESLKRLFGSIEFRDRVRGLQGQDKEDAVVEVYREILERVGGFNYTADALVLHKSNDSTRYHLIYATRNPKGVDVFKKSEKKAMMAMRKFRAESDRRRKKDDQIELFGAEVLHETPYFDLLRERYLEKGKNAVKAELQASQRVSYDKVWALALREPLVWESDLKDWIKEWDKDLTVEGLIGGKKVPKFGENHWLLWHGRKLE
jgi:three-Cys-motif partner protein